MSTRNSFDSLFESGFNPDDVPPPWAQNVYGSAGSMRVTGEYWIHPDGSLEFADGDVGDVNHEGLVMQHVLAALAEVVGIHDTESLEYDQIEEAAQEKGKSMEEVAQDAFPKIPVDATLRAANGRHDLTVSDDSGDLRAYAMRYFGWKWMRGADVTSWTLTPEDLKAIGRGVGDALEQEGCDDYEAMDDYKVTVRDGKGRSFEATIGALESGTLGARNATTWDNDKTGAEQTRKLDQQGTPDFYKGHLGDSLARRRLDGLFERRVDRA